MKDNTEVMHEFGALVIKALNDAGVKPIPGSEDEASAICAVMLLVGVFPNPPIGGAVNWNQDKNTWELAIQLLASEKCSPEEAAEIERQMFELRSEGKPS
jgi:hypothetical protein